MFCLNKSGGPKILNKRTESPALVSLLCDLVWVIKLHPGDLPGCKSHLMQAGSVSGWDANLENIVTCKARSLAHICTCNGWHSHQTGTEGLSEHPEEEGSWVSSLLVLLVTGETEHPTECISGPPEA